MKSFIKYITEGWGAEAQERERSKVKADWDALMQKYKSDSEMTKHLESLRGWKAEYAEIEAKKRMDPTRIDPRGRFHKVMFTDRKQWEKKAESMHAYISDNHATHRDAGTLGYWNKNAGEGWVLVKESTDESE